RPAAVGGDSSTLATRHAPTRPRTPPPRITAVNAPAAAPKGIIASREAVITPARDSSVRESTRVAPPAAAAPAADAGSRVTASPMTVADRLFAVARDAQEHGDFEKAKASYDQALAAGGGTPALYNNYAVLLLNHGNIAVAIDMLNAA